MGAILFGRGRLDTTGVILDTSHAIAPTEVVLRVNAD